MGATLDLSYFLLSINVCMYIYLGIQIQNFSNSLIIWENIRLLENSYIYKIGILMHFLWLFCLTNGTK